MSSFLNYAKEQAPEVYKALSGKAAGGSSFDAAWKSLAAKEPEYFSRVQHNYAVKNYYVPAVKNVLKATGLDAADRSTAVQEALWSTAVQHGSSGVAKVFKNAGITTSMSDAEIIRRIYTERASGNGSKYFPSSSAEIQRSVAKRFRNEMIDALKMLS